MPAGTRRWTGRSVLGAALCLCLHAAPGAAQNSKESSASEAEPIAEPAAIPERAAIARESRDIATDSAIDKEDRVPLPWSASLIWDHGYGVSGIFRETDQTFNPTYAWDLLLSVGYNFSRDTTLTLIQPIALELTDSETTSSRQELLFSDTMLDLSHTFLRTSPVEGQTLKLLAGGRLVLPTSKASQAATMVVGTRARIAARYIFDRVMHGLMARAEARYTRRWNRSNTGVVDVPFPCTTVSADAAQNCAHMGGSAAADALLFAVGGDLGFAKQWTFGLDVSFGWVRAHELGDAGVGIDTGVARVGDTGTHWRNSSVLELSLGYEFARWFSLYALVVNNYAQLGPNGKLRAPLDPQDTAVGARLVVSFDELYLSTHQHGGG